MNHVTQEQLVDHYYGEPQATLDVELHLAECEACRAQFQTLKRVLNSVEGYPVPEPAASYESRLWKKLAPEVSPQSKRGSEQDGGFPHGSRRVRSRRCWWWRFSPDEPRERRCRGRESRAARWTRARGVPVLVIAVGDHLERLEAVLTELENADVHRADLDISYEQRSAEDLLDSNRLFRQTAAAQGDVVTASVLEDFENVLLEITHQPAHVSAQQMEDLRRDIKDRGVLFKAKVLGSRMRGEETKL